MGIYGIDHLFETHVFSSLTVCQSLSVFYVACANFLSQNKIAIFVPKDFFDFYLSCLNFSIVFLLMGYFSMTMNTKTMKRPGIRVKQFDTHVSADTG